MSLIRTLERYVPVSLEVGALGLCTLAVASLSGCGGGGAAVALDDRTYRIEGPGLPSLSDGPNRRLAENACPHGYRVLDSSARRNSPDGIRDEIGMFLTWTIRCV